MTKAIVEKINLAVPISAVGKSFTGDYAKSPQYITEVQAILAKTSTSFIPNKAFGIYYDNPEKTEADKLKCFQGVFLQNETDKFDPSLKKLTLIGSYLYTKVSGDSSKIVYEGYNALFSHIQEHGIALRSNSGFQISTFENNMLTIEIYMEIF
jgi:DNA gyrase inhibitor GyrI